MDLKRRSVVHAALGDEPSASVNPIAIRVAGERGLDLSSAVPTGFESVSGTPDLIVSVCDRAREGPLPRAMRLVHWSIPDPVPVGKVQAFRRVFTEIEHRIDDLVGTART